MAAVGAVLSGLVGYWTTYRVVTSPNATQPAPTLSAASPLSIVVMPFANQTGQESRAYIADALTSSVTSDLSRIRDAYVAPVLTAVSLQKRSLSAQQVGKEAGVNFVLEGGVTESRGRLRVTTRLVDAATAAQVWTESFEGPVDDLFPLLDKITTRVGNSLSDHLLVTAAKKSESAKSTPKAVDLILQARALNLKPQSVENNLRVEALYRQALSEDPNNVTAMINLSGKLSTHASNYLDDGDPRKMTMLAESKELALKVREIDPSVAKVFQILGINAQESGHWDEALHDFEELIRMDPRSPSGYSGLAYWHRLNGEPAKALELYKKELEIDPRSDILLANLGVIYLTLGDNDQAIEWLSKAVDANSPDVEVEPSLAMAYANKGDMKRAAQHVAAYRAIAAKYGYKGIDESPVRPDFPPAFLKYYREQYVPEWKRAGLP